MKKEHFEVLLEEINNRVKNIAEGVSGLYEQVGALRLEVGVLKGEVIGFRDGLLNVENRLTLRMDGLDGAIQYLSSTLTSKIDETNNEVRRTMDRIENHEIRICRLKGTNS